MGKTRLVREYFREMDYAFIQMNSPQFADDSILDVLEARGMRGSFAEGSPQRRLRKLLESPAAPEYVILDDIGSVEPLQIALSARSSTVVVATARANILPAHSFVTIHVGPLERRGALSLLSQHDSRLSARECLLLNSILNGHPLAIKQAAAYLRRYPSVSVDEFCAALRRHSAEVLPSLPVAHSDVSILGVYQEVIAKLSGTLALQLLAARVFMAMPHTSLRRFLEAYGRSLLKLASAFPGVSDSQVEQAFDELSDLALIECGKNFIRMHPLTHATLRGLFSATGAETCERLIQVLPIASQDFIAWTREMLTAMGESFFEDSDEIFVGRDTFVAVQLE
jgi:hypothetical protein